MKPTDPSYANPIGCNVDQRFTPDEDLDHTRMPWQQPRFIGYKDPGTTKTPVGELRLPTHAEFYKQSFAWIVQNVLSEGGCAVFVTNVNMKGFTAARFNIGSGN